MVLTCEVDELLGKRASGGVSAEFPSALHNNGGSPLYDALHPKQGKLQLQIKTMSVKLRS